MIGLLYLAVFFVFGFATGKKLLRHFGFSFVSFPEDVAFSSAVGYAVLGYLVFVLGIFRLLYWQLFLVLFLVLSLLLLREIGYFFAGMLRCYNSFWKRRHTFNIYTVMLVFIIFLFFIGLIASLAPPFGMDVVIYHLAVPKLYLQNHGIFHVPFVMYSNLPFLVNMLYLVSLAFSPSGVFANLIAFSVACLLALSLYAFSRRFFSERKTGLVAMFIFFTMPFVVENITQAYIDIAFAFFSFMAFYALLVWYRCNEVKWLFLAGFLVASSASIKLLGLFNVALVGLFVLCKLMADINASNIRKLFLFCFVVLLFACLWYVKSFVYTGSPVWPYYYNLFGGRDWNGVVDGYYHSYISAQYSYRGFVSFLLLPWNITMHSQRLSVFLGLGPFFLAFIPLYFFFKRNNAVGMCLAYSFLYTVLWFFLVNANVRYYVVFPLLIVPAAYSARRLLAQDFFKPLIVLVVLSWIVFSSAVWYGANFKQLLPAVGVQSYEGFYSGLRYPSIYSACQYLNSLPDSRVLLYNNVGGFYCSSYVWGDPQVQAYVFYEDFNSSGQLKNYLLSLGITHMLVDSNNFRYQTKNYDYSMRLISGITGDSEVVFNESGVYVYEIR